MLILKNKFICVYIVIDRKHFIKYWSFSIAHAQTMMCVWLNSHAVKSHRNSYTMVCLPLCGDNPRALANTMYRIWKPRFIYILYHLHQGRFCTLRDISCWSWSGLNKTLVSTFSECWLQVPTENKSRRQYKLLLWFIIWDKLSHD